jgi:hypothetical protein
LAVIVVISPSLELGGSSKDHAMTVLTSHDTLVVEGLVHHFCGLILWSSRCIQTHSAGLVLSKELLALSQCQLREVPCRSLNSGHLTYLALQAARRETPGP